LDDVSGHSKWSTIKHKKGKADAARGRLFTKLIREITVAARMGGGDPGGNPRLRAAMDAARAANMPGDNMERAIKKGTGDLQGVQYEDITYEGYGPEGMALLVEATTDNRNRTVSEIRMIFNKNAGKMGEAGSVAWMFDPRGLVVVEADGVDEESLLMTIMEAGGEDMEREEDTYEITTPFVELDAVRQAVEAAGFKVIEAKPIRVPQTTVPLKGKHAEQALRLVDTLEDNDDVTRVWANFEIDEEELDRLQQ
jgi:YebC/PmpR family DNA-binding regulatory protein